MKEYLKTIIDKNKKLSDAIEKLHKGGMRIALVVDKKGLLIGTCLLYTSPSPRDS